MKRFAIIAALMLGATSISASAQELGGLLLNRDIMTTSDMFELSQTQLNFGTARSMAMGGAFTSLGADLSSMAINPAGIGMYRGGEVSITPMMGFNRALTKNVDMYDRNNSNRFSIGNFGFVINAHEGSSGLLSFNFAFGYNRIADLNYRQSFARQGNGTDGSIGDVFSIILQEAGVNRGDIPGGNNLEWTDINPYLWTSILGYKNGLTDQTADGWQPTWIGNGAIIDHYTQVESRGSIGEYDISMGANINNIIYIGATFGIQNLYQEKFYDYSEVYNYNDAPSNNYYLYDSNFNQAVILDGVGLNFKFGVTVRPTKNLRIGVAVHTPTYYSMTRKYQSYMSAAAHANNNVDNLPVDSRGDLFSEMSTDLLVDHGNMSWGFTSPARLLVGASYTFGNRGVISIDYQRDWFNGIRAKDFTAGLNKQTFYNDIFRNEYKGSNTIRVGAEFKPMPAVALRAGFGYQGSMHKDSDVVPATMQPETTSVTYYSAGVGFQLGRGYYIDLAYQYNTTKQSSYYLFYANGSNHTQSGLYNTKYTRHIAAITFGYKF